MAFAETRSRAPVPTLPALAEIASRICVNRTSVTVARRRRSFSRPKRSATRSSAPAAGRPRRGGEGPRPRPGEDALEQIADQERRGHPARGGLEPIRGDEEHELADAADDQKDQQGPEAEAHGGMPADVVEHGLRDQ